MATHALALTLRLLLLHLQLLGFFGKDAANAVLVQAALVRDPLEGFINPAVSARAPACAVCESHTGLDGKLKVCGGLALRGKRPSILSPCGYVRRLHLTLPSPQHTRVNEQGGATTHAQTYTYRDKHTLPPSGNLDDCRDLGNDMFEPHTGLDGKLEVCGGLERYILVSYAEVRNID